MEDRNLVVLAQQGNLEAEETLMRKYKETVRAKAKLYYMAGADEDDIVQEGMIGLLKAIRQYNGARDTAFSSFAGICITNQMISAIRSAGRDKHKPLNTSISLNKPVDEADADITIEDTLRDVTDANPEIVMVVKDVMECIKHNGEDIFSEFEVKVLNEVLRGGTYDEISRKLGKNYKSIENAVQRARKKIIDYLKQ